MQIPASERDTIPVKEKYEWFEAFDALIECYRANQIATTVPNRRAYDPCYAYEVATVLDYGMRRMMEEDKLSDARRIRRKVVDAAIARYEIEASEPAPWTS